jgi:hypothetical protein
MAPAHTLLRKLVTMALLACTMAGTALAQPALDGHLSVTYRGDGNA